MRRFVYYQPNLYPLVKSDIHVDFPCAVKWKGAWTLVAINLRDESPHLVMKKRRETRKVDLDEAERIVMRPPNARKRPILNNNGIDSGTEPRPCDTFSVKSGERGYVQMIMHKGMYAPF